MDFRRQLETKYQQSLGRAPAPTFVDMEGSVIWTQEYLRYRVNECDHNSAVQKVMRRSTAGRCRPPACRPAAIAPPRATAN